MAKIITSHKTYLPTPADAQPKWYLVDATNQVLGRLAVKIANILRGKNKATYTPHVDMGDFVVVLNAEKIILTGQKMDKKLYTHFSEFDNQTRIPVRTVLAKTPDRVLSMAVQRMFPNTRMARQMLTKLKIYAGTEHPHQAQQPIKLDLR